MALVTLPSTTAILASSTEWANPLFEEFWPYARWGLSIVVAGALVAIIVRAVIMLFEAITDRIRGGGWRR